MRAVVPWAILLASVVVPLSGANFEKAALGNAALGDAAAIARPGDLDMEMHAALDDDAYFRIDSPSHSIRSNPTQNNKNNNKNNNNDNHHHHLHRHQPHTSRPAVRNNIQVPPLEPQSTCHAVAEHYPSISVLWPSSAEYKLERARYWSTGCAALQPSCVMYPSSTAEVAAIVGVLGQDTHRFAVKSGGHNANPGFSSIGGGALIALGRLDEVTLDAERRTVRVGPGNRWEDVTAALEGTGFTVVGGRLGDVGVGGNLVGGGLSFLSTQYGWAASNVLEYQLVLANATPITVTLESYPDLFTALRGGGNSFGIVTSFLLEAKPIAPRVWGGHYLFLSSRATDVAVLRAIRDFTEHYPDPRAGLIAVHNTALFGLVDVWLLFLFYEGPSPPPGVFDNFTATFPPLPFTDTTGPKTYDALLRENNWGIVRNSGYVLATETTPLPRARHVDAVLGGYHARWREASRPVRRTWGLIASIVYQPIPRSMARIARAKPGGDLLDLDAGVDRLIIELDYSYWFSADFARVDAAMARGVRGIHGMIKRFVEDGTLRGDGHGKRLPPLFMNDADARQDYFGRLSEERRELVRRVKGEVDAGSMWSERTGGFKV